MTGSPRSLTRPVSHGQFFHTAEVIRSHDYWSIEEAEFNEVANRGCNAHTSANKDRL
jgi:hypothetical protein